MGKNGFWRHPAVRLAAVMVLYGGFTFYLFGPHLANFSPADYGFVITPFLAAVGTYLLSTRWLFSWTARLLAGAVYGFGPFALSFAMYRSPAAGLSYCLIPWLFLPAAFWHRGRNPDALRFCVRALFSLLPFAAIAGLFWLASIPSLGPTAILPIRTTLEPKDLYGLVFPLYNAGSSIIFGLYHTAAVLALMGAFVYLQIKRVTALIPAAAGLVLSFMDPVLGVSPLVWAAFAILFLAILSGVGLQSMISAGKTDSQWVMTCAAAASMLTAFAAALAIRIIFVRPAFELTAALYALTAAAMWITLFCIKKFPRYHLPRWILLSSAMIIDLIFSARYLIDKLF